MKREAGWGGGGEKWGGRRAIEGRVGAWEDYFLVILDVWMA